MFWHKRSIAERLSHAENQYKLFIPMIQRAYAKDGVDVSEEELIERFKRRSFLTLLQTDLSCLNNR